MFHGAWWDGAQYTARTFGPQSLNGQPGYYPVPSVSDLALWLQPLPGCYLDSTNLASAQLHTITVDFYTAAGALLESATPLPIDVDKPMHGDDHGADAEQDLGPTHAGSSRTTR